jgi:hypothetical protein
LAYSACALSKVKLGYWEGGNGKKWIWFNFTAAPDIFCPAGYFRICVSLSLFTKAINEKPRSRFYPKWCALCFLCVIPHNIIVHALSYLTFSTAKLNSNFVNILCTSKAKKNILKIGVSLKWWKTSL